MSRMIKAVELFASGVWNGRPFTTTDIDGIVNSFIALSLEGKVPLKLSHDGPDPREEPESRLALGWVRKVWRDGDRLLGDLDVPDKVATAIEEGYLKFVSVELLKNVRADTRVLPWVLDAVALLGADQPAVGVLKDLRASLFAAAATRLTYEARQIFHRSTGDSRNVSKESIKAVFNMAVKAGTCLPREQVMFEKRYGDTATVEDAVSWIESAQKPSRQNFGRPNSAAPNPDTQRMTSGDPGEDLVLAAREVMEEREVQGRPIDFDGAVRIAMQRNPMVAQSYKMRILGE